MLRALSTKISTASTRISVRRPEKKHENQQRINLASSSRKGKCHDDNEDRVVIRRNLIERSNSCEDEKPDLPKPTLDLSEISYLAVFDGHCGDDCSEFISSNLHEHIVTYARTSKCSTFEDLKYILADAFKSADDEFCEVFPEGISGSCAAIALIHRNEILLAHAGDCRAILRCNNQTVRLTNDHRASNEEELKRVTGNGGKIVNGRIGGVMSPTRSFGDLDVRVEWGDGILISEPDITYATLEPEDDPRMPSDARLPSSASASSTASNNNPVVFLLLGTDGIFDEMTSEEACTIIENSLRRFPGEPRRAAEKLTRTAIGKSGDDCTVALAVWSGNEPSTPSRVMSRRFDLTGPEDASTDVE